MGLHTRHEFSVCLRKTQVLEVKHVATKGNSRALVHFIRAAGMKTLGVSKTIYEANSLAQPPSALTSYTLNGVI